jgi:hypothetical protein
LCATPPTSTASSTSSYKPSSAASSDAGKARFGLQKLPPQLPPTASHEEFATQNQELHYLPDRACFQMEKDYALKVLMDKENGNSYMIN